MTPDTIRFAVKDRKFFDAVLKWRKNDLGGVLPARIDLDALRALADNGRAMRPGFRRCPPAPAVRPGPGRAAGFAGCGGDLRQARVL